MVKVWNKKKKKKKMRRKNVDGNVQKQQMRETKPVRKNLHNRV